MHDEHLISVEALASQIDQLILIDCRSDLFDASLGKQQYESGHIPNAAFFALHDALSGPKTPGSGRHPLPDQQALVQRMQSLGANVAVSIWSLILIGFVFAIVLVSLK